MSRFSSQGRSPFGREDEPRRGFFAALIATVFPPPRRKRNIGDAGALTQLILGQKATFIVLLVFLVVFGLGCLLLSMTNLNLLVVNIPKLVYISPLAFLLLLLAPWFWWMIAAGHSGIAANRAPWALAIRLTLLGLLIVLVTEPRAEQSNKDLTVIVVLDVSHSIESDAKKQGLGFVINTVKAKPKRDKIGVVLFGRDAAVEHIPSVAPPENQDIYNQYLTQVRMDGTDVGKGLELAAAMMRPNSQGRVVLVSDGVNTEGDFRQTLDELKSRGIAVDVLPYDYDVDREVWITRLDLPRYVKEGQTYEAAAIIETKQETDGTLILQENGAVIAEMPVKLQPGANRVTVPIRTRTGGFYEYEASIKVNESDDRVVENNTAQGYLFLEGKGKVLIATPTVALDPTEPDRDYRYIKLALEQAGRDVETMPIGDLPRDPLALLPYDAIIYPNVPYHEASDEQHKAVHDAVKNLGVGFLMVGGENSYGPGGYHNTSIEKILPVTMDITQRKVMPKGALVIILHTCEFANGNFWAKEITKKAIRVLNEQDDAGVLAYDWNGQDTWIVPLMPVSNYQTMMLPKINNVSIGDMPFFTPTMQLALQGLKGNDASTKHMIIISDGDPQPPSPKLLQDFVNNKITISTVGIAPHGPNVLPRIAQATGGKYYPATNPKQLPAIFMKEAKRIQRSMIREVKEGFVPVVTAPSPAIKDIGSTPNLYGYVITSMKGDKALNILEVPDTEDNDPLLAQWNFGLGKSAAFTSDLANRWAEDWVSWSKYQAFVKQLVNNIARVRKPSNLRIQSYAAGATGHIIVEDYSPNPSFLTLVGEVNGPDEKTVQVQLEQSGANRYEGRFELWGTGRYQIGVAALRKGEVNGNGEPAEGDGGENGETGEADPATAEASDVERVYGGFSVPYSQEYMRFHADRNALREIAEATDGRMLEWDPVTQRVYEVERTESKSSDSISKVMWLWVVLAFLLLFDVAARRVQIDWSIVATWFKSRSVESEGTMDALRKRKQSVAASVTRSEPTKPKPKSAGPPQKAMLDDVQVEDIQTTGPVTKKKTTQATGDEDGSTTERLLALKRKQQGGGEPKPPGGATPPPLPKDRDQ